MHEHAYYGRDNTIHSPGQIEWFQNTCDDKSFYVGGKQVINFLDGYSAPLQCRTGLMYMSLLGQPTDADLNTYPHMNLTGPHEWDPSVLDYTHPTTSGATEVCYLLEVSWHPGPIFLPANIYKLLSDVAIKELKKDNVTTSSTPSPKRAINTHDTDPDTEQPPTDTATCDPTPQIPLQTLICTTLNPVTPSPLMTPPLSTSWIPIPPLTLSIRLTSIMSLNPPLLFIDFLLIGEPMVALLDLM